MFKQLFILGVVLFVASAKNVPAPREEEEVALAMIECVRQALDGGLPEAGIPNHNPLVVPRNISIPLNITGILTGSLNFTDFVILDIVDFVMTEVIGQYVNGTSEISYSYKWWYDQLRINGNYLADLVILDVPFTVSGNLSLTLRDATLGGIWDMATDPKWLNNFTVRVTSNPVEFVITGLGLLDPIINDIVSLGLTNFFTNDSPIWLDVVSPALQNRFNTLWFPPEYWYRTDAIIANCQPAK